jgi:dipeptidyl aminopeptidase/acylaminoacyl peptidase
MASVSIADCLNGGVHPSPLRNLWVINNVDEAAVSPDGRRLALVIAESYDKQGQSQNAKLFLADAATGQSRIELGKYSEPVWSPDGTRIAAVFDGGIAILDAATRREIERVGLPKRDAPAQDPVWSPDGKSLLVGLYGENAGSGDPQSDYFLLNPVTRTWTPELTARGLLWLQPESVLYLRPYGTTPLAPDSPHNVWTSELAVYDLASHKDTALISGLVLNDDLSNCCH